MSRYERLRRCYADILALPEVPDEIGVMRVRMHLHVWRSPWRRLRRPILYRRASRRAWQVGWGVLRDRRTPVRRGLYTPTVDEMIERGES